MEREDGRTGLEVALIGMSCRFPGASDTGQFWSNLCAGVESITRFSRQELEAAGEDPALLAHPDYVPVSGVLDEVAAFDAPFFGMSPREAEILDPQHRIFLECAWAALEDAGYDPWSYRDWIGLYAGTGMSTYFLSNLRSNPELLASVGIFQVAMANDKDHLATRVSYKLNLRGPSLSVQTACSTALVAAHLACQGLLRGECDMALAGGVSLILPQVRGYLYLEGGILSPDGHCRAFDARAQGTVGGSGVGVVVLKRLEDALADGDSIYAVIRGSAINNDGALKVGYAAPGVEGQAKVIGAAHFMAGVRPREISYVEAHGTGTELGDPIEVAALSKVFRADSEEKQFCALGSVKSNIGHLDAAAGTAGLIKAALALKHKMVPPSLHYETPNRQIDFASSPFYVNTELRPWESGEEPRRAGVSSFGIGGTNVHLVLEEAPAVEDSDVGGPAHLLLLSARTPEALESATDRLAAFLEEHPDLHLADAAYTLQVGRKPFDCRRMLVCEQVGEAVSALREGGAGGLLSARKGAEEPSLIFVFPGQGAQFPGAFRELYELAPRLHLEVDRCAELLEPELGVDLRRLLFAPPEAESAVERLQQTAITQPALFTLEYSLACLWQAWGVLPRAMIGHSLGEYVAACLAGVLSLEEALSLVVVRGRLMQEIPGGAMLSAALPEEEVLGWLDGELSLAAVNGPDQCVLSGPVPAVEALEARLSEAEVRCRRLRTSHAFHSSMMDPMLESFRTHLQGISLAAPRIPYLSNLTGTWIRDEEAQDPDYWVRHLRHTVRFGDGVGELLKQGAQEGAQEGAQKGGQRVFLEVGPGEGLSSLVRRRRSEGAVVLSSGASARRDISEYRHLLATLGRLWLAGVDIDWPGFYTDQRRRRVALPSYPFERHRYWVEHRPFDLVHRDGGPVRASMADWFHLPVWRQSLAPGAVEWAEEAAVEGDTGAPCLVFLDACGVARELVAGLKLSGLRVLEVMPGEGFVQQGEDKYAIDPRRREDYKLLLQELRRCDAMPGAVVYAWSLTVPEGKVPEGMVPEGTAGEMSRVDERLQQAFFGPLFLAQAWGAHGLGAPLHILALTNGVASVTGEEELCPEKATLVGPCRVIPEEYSDLTFQILDIVVPAAGSETLGELVQKLLRELRSPSADPLVALRGPHRWVPVTEPVRLRGRSELPRRLRPQGVYLITGGLGGMGLALARFLATAVQARLVLVGRSPLPARQAWEDWLSSHEEGDRVSVKIRALQELEALGAQLQVAAADVADSEQMAAVIEQARGDFGAIHGVIHAAGVPPGGLIQLKTEEQALAGLSAKVHGTRVLERLLADQELDFFVLCSSLSALVAQPGRVDYCAANAFLDALAQQRSRSTATPMISVNWDGWQETGMAAEAALLHGLDPRQAVDGGLLTEEGIEVFRRILDLEVAQVVVTTRDLSKVQELLRRGSSAAAAGSQEAAGPDGSGQDDGAIGTGRRQHPRPQLGIPYVAPGTAAEKKICDVWEQLLGIEQIGIHDNFFELGGDSVITIQVLARLNQVGLQLTPKQVFDGQTVAELGALAGTEAAVVAEQGLVTGELPLTPIQGWFFDQELPHREHWNQAMMLEVRETLEPSLLAQVVGHLQLHHDALRLRYEPANGGWRQFIEGPDGAVPFLHVDLGALPEGRQGETLESIAESLQASLDLAAGPLFRVAFFDLGPGRSDRLLFVVHHLAIDAVSFRFLLEDLAVGYQRLRDGAAPQFPAKTTSFKDWAHRLTEHSADPEVLGELDYWANDRWRGVAPLPRDRPQGVNAIASQRNVVATLDAESTRFLVQEISKVFSVQINDVLLTALAQTFRSLTGRDELLIDLEGHGRDPIFDDVDLSRTVGWFTTLFPVLLQLEGGDPGAELKAIKEQSRQIPVRGIGYGLLRYVHPGGDDAVERLRQLPQAEVIFLYLGQLDQAVDESSPFRPAAEGKGPTYSPRGLRSYPIEVVAQVIGQKLIVTWTYSENLHDRGTIEGLAEAYLEALRALVDHCQTTEDAGYTPSDFATANLDQEELDDILSELGDFVE